MRLSELSPETVRTDPNWERIQVPTPEVYRHRGQFKGVARKVIGIGTQANGVEVCLDKELRMPLRDGDQAPGFEVHESTGDKILAGLKKIATVAASVQGNPLVGLVLRKLKVPTEKITKATDKLQRLTQDEAFGYVLSLVGLDHSGVLEAVAEIDRALAGGALTPDALARVKAALGKLKP